MRHARVLSLSLLTVASFMGAACSSDGSHDDTNDDTTPPLSLASITPDHGPLAGGTAIVVRGTGFRGGMSVRLGTATAESLVVVSATELAARTTAVTSAGAVDLVVAHADGASAALPGAFVYDEAPPPPPAPRVTACQLYEPAAQRLLLGPLAAMAEATFEDVSAGNAVYKEFGVGPAATTDPSMLTWQSSTTDTVLEQVTGTAVRAMRNLELTSAGSQIVAFRVSVDAGATWTYCDATGLDDGFALTDLPVLDVRPPIEWCNLQHPAAISVYESLAPPPAFGRVRLAGFSDGAGPAANVKAALGVGPAADAPSAASWSWSPATYNDAGPTAEADEYTAPLPALAPGNYAYAFRFTSDEGDHACIGQLEGGGYASLTVLPRAITNVRLVDVPVGAPQHGVTGLGLERAYVQVTAPGFTEGASASPALVVEVGLGPDGTDPVSSAAWAFTSATPHALGTPAAGTHEYAAVIPLPPAAGSYRLAARARFADAAIWVLGDLKGTALGAYANADAKAVEVATPATSSTLSYCETVSPSSVTVTMGAAGASTGIVWGVAYAAGVTPGEGWGAGLHAELGQGEGTDASLWTQWTPAGYRRSHYFNNQPENDEYEAALLLPPGSSGTNLHLGYRFTADGGATWVYCSSPRPLTID